MMRLLSIWIDCTSVAIFVIPALAILQCTIYRKWEFKPFCVKLIFAFYALALVFGCGCPCGWNISDGFWTESDTVCRHCK